MHILIRSSMIYLLKKGLWDHNFALTRSGLVSKWEEQNPSNITAIGNLRVKMELDAEIAKNQSA